MTVQAALTQGKGVARAALAAVKVG